ncbi:MAG TPA: hypothetical protein VFU91_10535 [Sphingomicrobium sp.]|jgi:hypothetical protein|nr:hypothetical protein [Sphingomicrobium sp.]
MTKFSANSKRIDPYKNFKFRVALFAAAGAIAGIVAGKLLDRTGDRSGD